MMDVFNTLYSRIFLGVIGISIQIVGIYALSKTKKKTSQVLMLMSLTVSEMILICVFFMMSIMGLIFYQDQHYQKADSYDEFDSLFLDSSIASWVVSTEGCADHCSNSIRMHSFCRACYILLLHPYYPYRKSVKACSARCRRCS